MLTYFGTLVFKFPDTQDPHCSLCELTLQCWRSNAFVLDLEPVILPFLVLLLLLVYCTYLLHRWTKENCSCMYNFVLFVRWLVSLVEIRLSEQGLPAECDIRSCLNTLQFLNKKKEALNIVSELIEIATCWLMLIFNRYSVHFSLVCFIEQSGFDSQVIGRKDMTKSIFDVWKQVWCFLTVMPAPYLFFLLLWIPSLASNQCILVQKLSARHKCIMQSMWWIASSNVVQFFIIANLLHRFFKRKNSSGQKWLIVMWAEIRTLVLSSHSYLTGNIYFSLLETLFLHELGSFPYYITSYLQWWLWCYYGWDSRKPLKTLLPWPNVAKDGIHSTYSYVAFDTFLFMYPHFILK